MVKEELVPLTMKEDVSDIYTSAADTHLLVLQSVLLLQPVLLPVLQPILLLQPVVLPVRLLLPAHLPVGGDMDIDQ